MVKKCAVFLIAVGKTKCPSQVKMMVRIKIRIQAESSQLLILQISFYGSPELLNLFLGGGAAHNGKCLAGQKHPDACLPDRQACLMSFPLHPLSLLIIVAVKKPFLQPLLPA